MEISQIILASVMGIAQSSVYHMFLRNILNPGRYSNHAVLHIVSVIISGIIFSVSQLWFICGLEYASLIIMLFYAMIAFDEAWQHVLSSVLTIGLILYHCACIADTLYIFLFNDVHGVAALSVVPQFLTLILSAALFFIFSRLRVDHAHLPFMPKALYWFIQASMIAMIEFSCTQTKTGVAVIGLSVITLLFAVLFAMMSDRVLKHAESEKDISETMTMQAHNDDIRSMYAAMKEYQHDMKHHFNLLEEMIARGQSSIGAAYLEKLQAPEWINQYCIGNIAVDALLTAKAAHIRQKGIKFNFAAYPLDELPISDTEFCAILGNILDNAIEAVGRIDDKSCIKEISLRFSRFRQMLYITCKNTADSSMIIRHGNLLFSSKRNGRPGRGIPSVRRIVDRASGLLSIEHADDKFIVSITLPYPINAAT